MSLILPSTFTLQLDATALAALDALVTRMQITGQIPKPAKPAPFRNVPRASRKEPAAYKKIKDRFGRIAEGHAAKKSRLAALKENTAAPLSSGKSEQQMGGEKPYKSLRTIRKELAADASKLLAAARLAEREEAEAKLAKEQAEGYRDILKEIAGYDPNELQGDGDVVFRSRAGARKSRKQSRHQIANIASYRESLHETASGRQHLAERDAMVRNALAEVAIKVGSFDNAYRHRPSPTPLPYISPREEHNRQFPAAPITDDDVRESINASLPVEHTLLTTVEEACQQIEQTDSRQEYGMEVCRTMRDDNEAPTANIIDIYGPDHPQYRMQQAASIFALAFATN